MAWIALPDAPLELFQKRQPLRWEIRERQELDSIPTRIEIHRASAVGNHANGQMTTAAANGCDQIAAGHATVLVRNQIDSPLAGLILHFFHTLT